MERRQQIVDAAGMIAAEGGIAAISVRGVAARAGVGASTLRHYFPTQRALYDAVVAERMDAQLADLRIGDRSLPPDRRLAECLQQFIPSGTTPAALEGWFALYAAGVGAHRTEHGARLLESSARHARSRVETWLGVLDEERALRTDDLPSTASLLLALIDGICLQMVTPGTPMTAATAHGLLDVAVRGVVATRS